MIECDYENILRTNQYEIPPLTFYVTVVLPQFTFYKLFVDHFNIVPTPPKYVAAIKKAELFIKRGVLNIDGKTYSSQNVTTTNLSSHG